jgi:hypothetical protein
MGPLAEIKRTSSFHPTPHFFDGHRRPRLYRTCILNQLISLFKYPSRLSAKPNLGGTGGHFDPRIVQTSQEDLARIIQPIDPLVAQTVVLA